MKRVIEVSAKTVEAAISDGLSQLGITMDEADIKVINAGGLFKKAKIEISTGEDDAVQAKSKPQNDNNNDMTKKPKAQKSSTEKPKVIEEKKPEQSTNEQKKTEPKKFEPKKFEPKKVEQKKVEQKKVEQTTATQNNTQTEKKTFLKKEVQALMSSTAEKSQKPFEKTNSFKNDFKSDSKKREKKPFNPKPIVSAEVTQENRDVATSFLTNLLKHMCVEGDIEITEDNGMRIVINTQDSSIIGYRGEVLDSIQYLTSLKVNEKLGKSHILLSVDALGYRDKRVETLKKLAQKTAEKCIKINRRVSLEPMNSADRRIIHAELSENEKVITRSEGHEPTRRIVVLPRR